MTAAPKIPLADPLKTLKLPTFLREYEKLARPAADAARTDGGGCRQNRSRRMPPEPTAADAARTEVGAHPRARAPPRGWTMSSSWPVWWSSN